MKKYILSVVLVITLFISNIRTYAVSCSFEENFDNIEEDFYSNYRMQGNVDTYTDDSYSYIKIASNSYFEKLYKTPVEGNLYMSCYIYSEDGSGYIKIKDSLSKLQDVLKFTKNSFYSGSSLTKEGEASIWHHIELEAKGKLINVYVDDEFIGKVTKEDNIQFIRFGCDNGELKLGSLKVYEGEKPKEIEYSDEEVKVIYQEGFNSSRDSFNGGFAINFNDQITFQNGKGVNGKGMCIESLANGTNQEPTVQITTKLENKIVYSFHIKMQDFKCGAMLALIKSNENVSTQFGAITTNGMLCAITNGWNRTPIKKLEAGKWYTIQYVADFKNHIYDVYLDYQKIASNIDFGFGNVDNAIWSRFAIQDPGGVGGKMFIDNVTVYTGSNVLVAPRLEKELNTVSDNPNESRKTQLSAGSTRNPIGEVYEIALRDKMSNNNAIAMMIGERGAYKKDRKIFLSTAPEIKNGRTFIPLRGVSEAFNLDISWDDEKSEATVKTEKSDLRFYNGKNEYFAGSTTKKLDAPAYINNGSLMVPVRVIAEEMNKKITFEEPQLIIIGDTENFLRNDSNRYLTNELIQTIIFDRPSRAEIISAIQKKGGITHPSLCATRENYEFARKQYQLGIEPYKRWGDSLIKEADTCLNKPTVKKTDYTSSNNFLDVSRAVRKVVDCSVMSYWLTGDTKYAERIWSEVDAAIKLGTWEPGHFLNVSEMTFGIALAYDSLFDYWTEDRKKIMKDGILTLGLMPALDAYHDSGAIREWNKVGFWVVLNSNWNLVCNGGIMTGALMLSEDEPAISGEILESALRSEEYGLLNFFPDGGWDEGSNYWKFALDYFSYSTTSLLNCVGKDYGIRKTPGLDITGYYPFRIYGAQEDNNFHDAAEGGKKGIEAPFEFWLSNWYKDKNLNSLRFDAMKNTSFATMYDMLWYNPNLYSEGAVISLDGNVRNVESGSFRNYWNNKDATVLMYHSGDVDANHAHLDVGNFLFDTDGQRWAIDLGMDNYYLPGYNEGQRYEYYRTRTEGHNTLVINPTKDGGQLLGERAKIENFVSKPKGGFAVTDLTTVYKGLKSYKRGFMLTNNRNVAIVQDEVETDSPSEIYWFMHTRADITISPDGKSAILTMNGKKVKVQLLSADGRFEVMDARPLPSSPNDENQNKNEGVRKLTIHLKDVTKTTISVAMHSVSLDQSYNIDLLPIKDWSIPDGEIQNITIDSINVDGQPLQGFNPNVWDYVIEKPFGDLSLSTVSAQSDKYNITVENPQTMPGTATVIVRDKNDPTVQSSYNIRFKSKVTEGIIDAQRHVIRGVTASAEPQSENPKESSFDGNIETRWSAEGEQWITYDIGQVDTVSAISIAFLESGTRKSMFEIHVSTDGVNFTRIADLESAGNINGYETFALNPSQARYVRILGRGNSLNRWNSINEVILFK